MTCEEALDLILEADPQSLEGRRDSPLAEHLGMCTRCQSTANVILEEEAQLSKAMTREAPRVDSLAILAAAEKRRVTPIGTPFLPPRWRIRSRNLAMAGLASAAAVIALLLGKNPSLPGPEYSVPQVARTGLDLQVPDGRTAAVLETNNPDITVLWLFDGE